MTIDFRNGDEMVIKNKLRISYSYNSQLFVYKLSHTFSHIFSSYLYSYLYYILLISWFINTHKFLHKIIPNMFICRNFQYKKYFFV